jgi:hypothetical protein
MQAQNPVGARSCATGVARLTKMNRELLVVPKSDYRTRRDGFETCYAGRAGARPYRRKGLSRRRGRPRFGRSLALTRPMLVLFKSDGRERRQGQTERM